MPFIENKNYLNKIIISENQKISEALNIINENETKICFVVDKNNKFLKTVTDGDIRRYLIKSLDLNVPIKNCHNRKSNFLIKNDSNTYGPMDFTGNVIFPILDNKNFIVGIYIDEAEYKTDQSQYSVAIYGLGYVGLTLGLALANTGYNILGYDSDKKLIRKLKNKKFTFYEDNIDLYIDRNIGVNFIPISEHKYIKSNVHIICVGTPISKQNKTLFETLLNVTKLIASKIKKNDLVILRSTVEVGTTRNVVIPNLEKISKLKASIDFNVAFCPERTIEGDAMNELQNLPQLIGGSSESCYRKASNFFNFFAKTVVDMNNLESAEIAKLVDNSYRDYTFGYSNFLAKVCNNYNIESRTLIGKINTGYPRNNIPYPSPGVGGPCLSKDSYIFRNSLTKLNIKNTNILLMGRVNSIDIIKNIHKRIMKKINYLFNNNDNNIINILLLGLAFKGNPPTSDYRNSTSFDLINQFNKQKINFLIYDEFIDNKEIKTLNLNPVNLDEGLNKCDVLIVMNNNKNYKKINLDKISFRKKTPLIVFDCWSLLNSYNNLENKKLIYMGI